MQGRLDAVPSDGYDSDPGELPSILFNGTFATPTPNLGDLFQDDLMDTIVAFLINQLWNQAGTIVIKATQADFAEGSNTNICDGDNILPAGAKFCDADGNAFILQTPPSEAKIKGAGLSSGALSDLVRTEYSEVAGLSRSRLLITCLHSLSSLYQVSMGSESSVSTFRPSHRRLSSIKGRTATAGYLATATSPRES